MPGHVVHRRLDHIVCRRLAKTAHGHLAAFIGADRNRLVFHRVDFVRPYNGADRLGQLKRRAARIGAGIVQGANLYGLDDAVLVEGNVGIEYAVRAMGVAARHVGQAVLDKTHWNPQLAGKITHQDALLDAPLYTIAAAHVHILMQTNAV